MSSNNIQIKHNNKSINLSQPKQDIKNDWLSTLFWNVFGQYDKDKNGELDQSEISVFNNQVIKSAGNDGVLDNTELKKLAQKLNVPVEDLSKSITLVSASILAGNISETVHPGLFKNVDKKKFKEFLNGINSDNAGEVWSQFSNYENNRLIRYRGSTTLADQIVKNFSVQEAKPLLRDLFRKLYNDCKSMGLDNRELMNTFKTALNNDDINGMHSALNELGTRFHNSQRTKNGVWLHANLDKNVPTGSLKDKEYADEMETVQNYATSSGAEITDDLLGDGVLANTETKVTTGNAQARMILQAFNELFQDKTIKEKIQACYRKEDNQYVVFFPSQDVRICLSDREFLMYENVLKKGVIGDGDMTVLVAAINRQLEIDNATKGLKINTTEEIKKYIELLFDI